MNFRTTYVLFGVLLVIIAIFTFALFWGPGKTNTSAYVLPAIHDEANPMEVAQVERVEIQPAKGKALVFKKNPETDKWAIAEPRKLRADQFAVQELVRQIHDAKPAKHFDKPKDLADWGLEPPQRVITLVKGERQVKLEIGDSTGERSSDVIYVRDPARGEAVPVDHNSLDSVLKELNAFRARDLLGSSYTDIKVVALSESKDHPEGVELKEVKGTQWRYVKPDYGEATYESTGPAGVGSSSLSVSSLIRDIANLRVNHPEKGGFIDDVKDLSKYNLDPSASNVLRLKIERVDKAADASGKGEQRSSPVLLVGLKEKVGENKDSYYATVEGQEGVVLVAADSVEPFRKLLEDPAALRDRDLVRLPSGKKPDAINIQNTYGTLEFRKADSLSGWKLYRDDREQTVQEQAVNALIDKLTTRGLVKEFRDAKDRKELGLEKPQAEVSLWVEGLSTEEKKEGEDKEDEKKEDKEGKPKLKDPNKPTYRLNFGNEVQGNVAVERESSGAIVLVPAEVLDLVKRGPLAYLDKTIPSFTTESSDLGKDITRVVLQRKQETIELEPTEGGKGWKITRPDTLKGRKADNQAVTAILLQLNHLFAQQLVAESPSPEKLDSDYGLKSPQAKVVLTIKKDDKEKVYEYAFGKKAEDDTIYAMQNQRDVVFTVNRGVLDTLSQDLRDATVFDFGISKVKKVRLEGWRNILPTPYTLEAERQSASQWNVKQPKDVTIDASKMEQFISNLAHLRASKFLRDGKPSTGDGLTVDKGALLITIYLEGAEDKPLTLTVGNEVDKEAGYKAMSNQVPGAIFEVRRELFEEPRKRPNYFSP
jgi:hypothetical protein